MGPGQSPIGEAGNKAVESLELPGSFTLIKIVLILQKKKKKKERKINQLKKI